MNRSLLILPLWAFLSYAVTAQDNYGLCRQVVATAGKSATMAGRHWSYTVGEPFITTLSGNTRIVTQGFQQPELCGLVTINDLDLASWELAVFPNPTADFLTVQYAAGQTGGLEATVFDLLGRAVLMDLELQTPQGSRIDASSWKAGLYLLQLRDPRSGASATFRIIRL